MNPLPTSKNLYWSKHGNIACEIHLPSLSDARRHSEAWALIPETAMPLRGGRCQCQYCSTGAARRMRHDTPNSESHLKDFEHRLLQMLRGSDGTESRVPVTNRLVSTVAPRRR